MKLLFLFENISLMIIVPHLSHLISFCFIALPHLISLPSRSNMSDRVPNSLTTLLHTTRLLTPSPSPERRYQKQTILSVFIRRQVEKREEIKRRGVEDNPTDLTLMLLSELTPPPTSAISTEICFLSLYVSCGSFCFLLLCI
jgi:hypothetical protein